jgi:hypothetical protein
VKIGPADTARLHVEHDIVCAGDGLVRLFHRNVLDSAIDTDSHDGDPIR